MGIKESILAYKTQLASIQVTNGDGNAASMYVAMWNNQIERKKAGTGYDYPTPASFLEVQFSEGTSIGMGATSYELTLRIMLEYQHYNTENSFDEDMTVFDLKDKVHRKMNMFKVANCSPLCIGNPTMDYNHDNTYLCVMEYKTHFIDYTGSMYDYDGGVYIEDTIENPVLEIEENIYTGAIPEEGGGSFDTITGNIIPGNGIGIHQWYTGAGVPILTANNGDYYRDTDNGDIYYLQAGIWSWVGNILNTGGGDVAWTDVTVTDADFTAVDGSRYILNASVLTANRIVNMSGITNRVMFVVAEDADVFYLSFTGATVYRKGGAESFTQINGLWATVIETIGGKLIQTS